MTNRLYVGVEGSNTIIEVNTDKEMTNTLISIPTPPGNVSGTLSMVSDLSGNLFPERCKQRFNAKTKKGTKSINQLRQVSISIVSGSSRTTCCDTKRHGIGTY